MLSLRHLLYIANVEYPSFRAWTTGYLILFDPHAFVPQCQYIRSELPSQLVFYVISKHFTAT